MSAGKIKKQKKQNGWAIEKNYDFTKILKIYLQTTSFLNKTGAWRNFKTLFDRCFD